MRLEGKTAIVTGGGRGIGRAIALGFAAEGARVVVTARTADEIDQVAQEIGTGGGESLAAPCDVTDEEGVKALVEEATEAFGGVDVLVNNAGIATARPVWGLSAEAFVSVLQVNLVGSFLCTKHVWRGMKKAGGGSIINVSSMGGIVGYPMLSAYCASKSGQIGLTKAGGGSIINVSSMGGIVGYPMLSAYCASKSGQIGLTKACAEEGKADGIRVNAIAPGKGDTKLRAGIEEDKARLLRPEDHVGVSIFLASDEAQYVTGQVIPLEWYGPD